MAKAGLGINFWTPGKPSDYATTDAEKAVAEMTNLSVPGPSASIRNPNLSKVQLTLQGPDQSNILMGIYTGQIEDVDAALQDLDKRYTDALTQAIADANAAGVKVSIDDYLFPDFDPAKPYVQAAAK